MLDPSMNLSRIFEEKYGRETIVRSYRGSGRPVVAVSEFSSAAVLLIRSRLSVGAKELVSSAAKPSRWIPRLLVKTGASGGCTKQESQTDPLS